MSPKGVPALWALLLGLLVAAAATPDLLSSTASTFPRHRQLLQDAAVRVAAAAQPSGPTCGVQSASRFNLPQVLGPRGVLSDSSQDLELADADDASDVIYVDVWEGEVSGAPRQSQRTVLVERTVQLSKPLVLSGLVEVEVGPGAELRLAAQPFLPDRQVLSGVGSVRFVAGAVDEFLVRPEWFVGGTASDRFDQVNLACSGPGVRCLVVLSTRDYKLARPWRIGPNIRIWGGATAIFKPDGGNTAGIIVGSGEYDPTRRMDLPRMWLFGEYAIKIEDVSGLWLYCNNMVQNRVGVLLAPRRAIRDTLIEAPSTALSNNIFTVEPAAAGASLVNVHLKAHAYSGGVPGFSPLTHFTGAFTPTLKNVTVWDLLNTPAKIKTLSPKVAAFSLLVNDGPATIDGLTLHAPLFNGPFPKGWTAVKGKFTNLRALVRLTQDYFGVMGWQGAGNVLNWGGLSRLVLKPKELKARTLLTRPSAKAMPLTRNSEVLALPLPLPDWKAGATRTFYAYHVFANGATDSRTMSLGPHNHAKMPAPGRTVNPGIVVAGVEDQGKKVKSQIAITLKNVSGRTIPASEWTDRKWKFGLRFRLQIGVAQLE